MDIGYRAYLLSRRAYTHILRISLHRSTSSHFTYRFPPFTLKIVSHRVFLFPNPPLGSKDMEIGNVGSTERININGD